MPATTAWRKPSRVRVSVRTAICMKKPGKKGGVVEDDGANAFDVMAGIAAAAEGRDLLAEALGKTNNAQEDTTQDAGAKKEKKDKKKKKAGIIGEDESNAVDVFGGIAAAAASKDLLKNALGLSDDVEITSVQDLALSKKDKKKKKDKKQSGKAGANGSEQEEGEEAEDIDEAAVEQSFASMEVLETEKDWQQQHQQQLGKKKDKKKDKETISMAAPAATAAAPPPQVVQSPLKSNGKKPGIDETDIETASESDEERAPLFSLSDSENDEASDRENPEDDNAPIELDEEGKVEFEAFIHEVEDFTFAGRRKKAKATFSAQNQRASFGQGGEKFTQIRFEDIGMQFQGRDVLKSVTWEVKTGERVGLVGRNGCGKSTQLRMIAGEIEPTSGEIIRSSNRTRCAVLRQEFVEDLVTTRTLNEEFLASFESEKTAVARYEKAEAEVAACGDDLVKMESLLNELEDARIECEQLDAWNLQPRIDKLIPGLGFDQADLDRLVGSFSGGWKVRIGLGKVLLKNPDILLLDEPTNHLDLESVEWIEGYLRQSDLPMVIVSHDREFMDRLCNKIVEIEAGEAFSYKGNYSRFLKLKDEQRSSWEAAYARQQEFINEQKRYIKMYRRSAARVQQVKSREKMLERMERNGELVREPPKKTKPLVFRFPPAPRSARDVIILEDVCHSYGDKVLLEDTSIALERGDKVAIVGPNGCGKSTLLRLILGMEKPKSGTVECVNLINAVPAYFAQNQADALPLDKTVLETISEAAPADMKYEDVRALLGKFLFKGEEVNNKVSLLSGGEKARLALCKIMLTPANILLFDEPTNHLDIPAKEMLEEALQHYDGTMVVVSHDRYFVSQVARQIIAVEDKHLELYDGDYKYYVEQNEKIREKLAQRAIQGVTDIKKAPVVEIEAAPEVTKAERKKNFGGSGVGSGKSKTMNAKRWSNL
eukprot:CAMPEP_0184695876 /NCGR_PEP_ID=MMETSP0313-20130426/3363_1 /TAXON_ID=2792 /ORGANISM="Porphyridium aerugineum, Strain SAG 1380-2" /LENGTH=938 /DNA_ID=CAMNT_0027154403 /DNA_START=166 /DNA_END=2982 /DNA_ORIENTATION=-